MSSPDHALDMPDDSPWLPNSTRTPILDLGEVVARLNSPAVFDRRGEVQWFDEFRNGVTPWQFAPAGAGTAYTIINTQSYRSPYSLNIALPAGGVHSLDVYRIFSVTELTRMGLEVCAYLFANTYHFDLVMFSIVGGVKYSAEVDIKDNTQTLEVVDLTGGHDFATYPLTIGSAGGNPVIAKLVVDFQTKKYVRFILGQNEYDLSAYALKSAAGNPNDYNQAGILHYSDGSNATHSILSHAIITSNEP